MNKPNHHHHQYHRRRQRHKQQQQQYHLQRQIIFNYHQHYSRHNSRSFHLLLVEIHLNQRKSSFYFFFSFVLFLVANMTHLQNYFKLSAASVLNDSIVGENRFLLDVKTKINFTFRISKTEIIVRLYHLHFFLV